MSELFHAATAEVAVPAVRAFEYLGDGIRQGDWTLGSWDRERVGDDLFRGRSLYNGREVYVRILRDPERLIVDYEVGPAPESLIRRISARVVDGPTLRRAEGTCVVTLMVWRTPDQDDEAWRQVGEIHRAEMHLIKGRLELGF